MSYCTEKGKDRIIFATEEDLKTPSRALIGIEANEDEEEPGLILPNGDINWNCPCLGGMASGPCGPSFREAFSCFHYSEADPKGSDCYEQFREMQNCMTQYPEMYPSKDDGETEQMVDGAKDQMEIEEGKETTPLSQTAENNNKLDSSKNQVVPEEVS